MVGAWIVLCPARTPRLSTWSSVGWTSSLRSVRSSAPSVRGRSSCCGSRGDQGARGGRGLRVLAASDDIAEATGDRSTAAWLATQTRDNHGTVRRHAALAASLGSTWTQTAEALGAGDLNVAQARVIVEALDALPDELGDDLVVKAEAYLVEQAAVSGRGSCATSAAVSSSTSPPRSPTRPSTSGCSPRRPAPTRRPGCRSRLAVTGPPTSTPGSPTTSPTGCATYLDAYTSPRRTPLGEVDQLPIARRRGEAFVAFLENLPDTGLPVHGGTTTSVMVTLDLDTLLTGIGVADHLDRGPGHRRTGPPARLPGADHPRRPRQEG